MTAHTQKLTRFNPHLIYGSDAVVSALMGIALLATATPLTAMVEWTLPASFLWTVGLLLLPWATFNLWIALTARPASSVVTGNILGDTAWVVGSAVLVAVQAPSLSQLGLLLLVAQGIAVAVVLLTKILGRAELVR